MLKKLHAIVLGLFDSGETSLVARVLSAEEGLISVMAKGARASKSRVGAVLQPLALLEIEVSHGGSGMATLRTASALHAHGEFAREPRRLAAGCVAAEAASLFAAEGVRAVELVASLAESLHALAQAPAASLDAALADALRGAAAQAGVLPRIDAELLERRGAPKPALFWLDTRDGALHARGPQPREAPEWPLAIAAGAREVPVPPSFLRAVYQHGGEPPPAPPPVEARAAVEAWIRFLEAQAGAPLRSVPTWRALRG
ncbi:MAG: DNA repair protein RecO [Candidatus Sumerlaeia bacterium]|nr:DNA repair protein RecO [Candidatus Sumerlaeia bacterium]